MSMIQGFNDSCQRMNDIFLSQDYKVIKRSISLDRPDPGGYSLV